jgi:hypothetical protein
MPRFAIFPTDQSTHSAEIEARSAATVLCKLIQLGCNEADVLEDGQYTFSVRLGTAGVWSIYQRERLPLAQETFG